MKHVEEFMCSKNKIPETVMTRSQVVAWKQGDISSRRGLQGCQTTDAPAVLVTKVHARAQLLGLLSVVALFSGGCHQQPHAGVCENQLVLVGALLHHIQTLAPGDACGSHSDCICTPATETIILVSRKSIGQLQTKMGQEVQKA